MAHELAGKEVPQDALVNIPALIAQYYTGKPDPAEPTQRVSFGTSGHRGTSLNNSFNDDHIAAITQAIVEYRANAHITGPLFLGMDTHALSEPAHRTAIEVLAANGVLTRIAKGGEYTPTPVISHAIITYNRGRADDLADGIVITPSHNPPTDGGFKYNPTHGGPADTDATGAIAKRANQLLENHNRDVKRIPLQQALKADCIQEHDYVTPYVDDLRNIIDFDVIRNAGLRIAADALGGAGLHFWRPIAETYGLDLTIYNSAPNPTFGFMRFDHDGKIRMDCSSPYAMAGLIRLRKDFDIAVANDPDFDRHGIVAPSAGLMNPNHYLAVAIRYLFQTRKNWPADAKVGKTAVSSSLIDKVASGIGRQLHEVPVGFKWFVPGLSQHWLGFGGEESAGASFLRLDGTTWTTDKDGFILALLAAEITAATGKDPAQHYEDIVAQYGRSYYQRIDSPASPEQKAAILKLNPDAIAATTLAGDPITAKLTNAPGNHASIGGLKVVTDRGWFAVRPSGTENISKVYAESLVSEAHLKQIQQEATAILSSLN